MENNLNMSSVLEELSVVKPIPRKDETMSLKALNFIKAPAVNSGTTKVATALTLSKKASPTNVALLSEIRKFQGSKQLKKVNNKHSNRLSISSSESEGKAKRLMMKSKRANRRKAKKNRRGSDYADKMKSKVARRGKKYGKRHSPY
eukprot:g5932.t1